MPRAKAKPLNHYPADWVYAIRNAMAEEGKPFTIAQGSGGSAYNNTRARLTAMRNGIKQFEPIDSPMRRAAEGQRLRFNIAEPIGEHGWRLVVVFTGLQLRPSEEFAKNWEDYRNGLRSTPF